jgi:ABC-type uncharacterized transport system ATPase component
MTLTFSAAMKQAVAEQIARGRSPASVTRPVFVVVCGINGAGKSTLADALAGSPEFGGMAIAGHSDRTGEALTQASRPACVSASSAEAAGWLLNSTPDAALS